MNDELLEMFIKEDWDQHAKSVLLASIKAKTGTDGKEDLTFNRFNIHLDLGAGEAVIDDDLNPDGDVCRLPLANFAERVQAV